MNTESHSSLDTEPPDPRRGEHISVLVVEDSEVDGLLLERKLAEQGCDVARVGTLTASIEHLQECPADVVLLDLELPDATGVEGMQRLRTAFPYLPTVIITGRDDQGLVSRALRAGAQDYLPKEGINAQEVVRSLRYAMARKHSERLRHRLEHADRLASLGQLSAGVAHEINNPLAFLIANMEMEAEHLQALRKLAGSLSELAKDSTEVQHLLAEHQVDHRLQDLGAILADNLGGAERIRTIVKDLRGFARSERSRMTEVDLNDTVLTAINITRNEVRHRARLETDLSDNLPAMSGDQGRLCQVVVNLLVNAAQAIEPGHAENNVIAVSTHAAGNGVRLQIRDSGCGIAKHNVHRVFEPFFTTKSRETGTGLGLALCAETVRHHNGHIEVSSEPGEGTTIEIRLPAEHGLPAPVKRLSLPPAAPENGQILLIDDDPGVRRTFAHTLENEGYVITETSSALEALQVLERNQRFDAIVCDLVMPDLDGPELYHHLELHHPELLPRVVFVSGSVSTPDTRAFVEETNVPVLLKPPQTQALQQLIRSIAKAS